MRSHFTTQKSKFFRIWTFVLLFLTANTLGKPAWGLIGQSSVDKCLSQLKCVEALGSELAPAIAAPDVGGTIAIMATTDKGKKTISEVVSGVALVEDIRLSGILGYRIWQLEQNKKAQEKAKQRYCAAYPTDVVCPRKLTGVPYRIIGDIYYEAPRQAIVGNYWQTVFTPVVYHLDSYTSYPYGAVHAVYLQLTPKPQYTTTAPYSNEPIEYYLYVLTVAYGDPVRVQGWVSGGGYTRAGQPPKLLNLKIFPLNGEQEPPGLPWKDWPQEKRSIAVAALKEPDWQEFIKSMPEGGRLIPGDRLDAPVIVIPGLDTDDLNTPEDDRLPTKKPDFSVPLDDFDYDGNPDDFDTDDDDDGLLDTSDPAPRNSVVPTANDDDDSLTSEPGELIPNTPEHKADRWVKYQNREGTQNWDYERWSENYDQNMVRAKNANAAVDVYHREVQWGEREVTVDAGGQKRRLDIADEEAQKGVEYKTGYVTRSPEINSEVSRDAALVKEGWAIEWVFQGSASKPLLEDLSSAGITYSFRTP